MKTKKTHIIAAVMSLVMLFSLIPANLLTASANDVITQFDLQTALADIPAGFVIEERVNGIQPAGPAVLTVTDEGSGKKGITVTNRTDSWNAIDISIAVLDLFAGQDYIFSVSGRTSGNTGVQTQVTGTWTPVINQGNHNGAFTRSQTHNSLSANIANAWNENIRIQTTNTATYTITDFIVTTTTPKPSAWDEVPSLKDAYASFFPIGNLDTQYSSGFQSMWLRHYNAITAENAMKPNAWGSQANHAVIPSGVTNMMNWARNNDIEVHGHVLVWHSQSATWMTHTGSGSNIVYRTRAQAKANLETFIKGVAEHFENNYKDELVSWDVVNEAFENGNGFWRESLRENVPWFLAYENGADKAAGEFGGDYLYDAFVFARKYAPSAKLYYNDFNMDTPSKFTAVADMVCELNAQWARDTVNNPQANAALTGSQMQIINAYKAAGGRLLIETVGLQSHQVVGGSLKNIEDSITTMVDAGVTVAITELDIAIPNTRHNPAGQRIRPTEEQLLTQGRWTAQLFQIYRKHAAHIERVTWWGVADGNSWIDGNDAAYGLLFTDTGYDGTGVRRAKPAYWAMLNPDKFLAQYGYGDSGPLEAPRRQFTFASKGTPDIADFGLAQWQLAAPGWARNVATVRSDRFVDNTTDGATGTTTVLWDDDNLYVRVEVAKEGPLYTHNDPWQNDSVEVFLSESNNRSSLYRNDGSDGQYRVNFQNTASFDKGANTSVGFESYVQVLPGEGYIVQMKIPFRLSAPKDMQDVGFDVQINTNTGSSRTGIAVWCDTSGGGLWQSPTPMGQLTLIDGADPRRDTMSSGTAVYGSPAGINDPVWAEASELLVDKWVTDASVRGATGVAKTMWDENYLYTVIDVTDSLIDVSNGNTWLQDSIEFCLDKNRVKRADYPSASNGGQYRVTLDEAIHTNPADISADVLREVEMTATGYKIYIAMPINNMNLSADTGGMVAFDIQINDAANGDRFGIATWSDMTAAGYSNSTRFGDLTLAPKTLPGFAGWSFATEPDVADLTDGTVFAAAGPMSSSGSATLTVRENMPLRDIHGWTHLDRSFKGFQLTRPAASDRLLIDPDILGLVPGVNYVWEVEGYRASGTHRPAISPMRGNTAVSTTTAAPLANNNTNRQGYFTMSIGFEHAADITAYSFHGVGSNNTNATAGELFVYRISVRSTNSYVLYDEDFSDGFGDVLKGAKSDTEQLIWTIIDDPSNPGNKILHTSMEGPGYAGFDILDLDVPEGAYVTASTRVRRASANDGYTGTSTFRIATGVAGTVANWEAVRDRKALTTEWQIYTVTMQLPAGTTVHAFQFCKDTEAYTGILEFDWVYVEILDAPPPIPPASWQPSSEVPSLADAFADYFTLGNILDRIPGSEVEEMFLHQYNSVTMENAMKPGGMSPAKGVYTLDHASEFAEWALSRNLEFIGHTLVWHAQSAAWLNMNPDGTPVTYAEARENLEDFIKNVAGHFAGKVDAWDVLNELFHSGGGTATNRWWTNIRTNSTNGHPWRAAYANQAPAGVNDHDFVYDAFMLTRKYDPNAKLVYNDYNNDSTTKSQNIRDMVNNINAIWATDTVNNPQAKASYGTPGLGANATAWRANDVAIVQAYFNDGGRLLIESIGMQTHFQANTSLANVRTSLGNFMGAVGVTLHVTELDVGSGSFSGNTYNPGTQRTMYENLFRLYMDNAHRIERVTFWGTNDIQHWRSNESGTLFARPTAYDPVFRAKPALHAVAALTNPNPPAGFANYTATGLSAAFAGGAGEIVVGRAAAFQVNLTAEGSATFTVTDTPAIANFIANGLPQGLSVTAVTINDSKNATITISGTPAATGSFNLYPQVRLGSSGSATAGTTNVIGDWLGTRIVQPLVLAVRDPYVYTVTFDANGGELSGPESIPVIEGETVDFPEPPTKAGYTFQGWLLDDAAFDVATLVFGDITLVAQWDKIPLTSIRIAYNNAPAATMIAVLRNTEYRFSIIELETGALYNVTWTVNNANLGSVSIDDDGNAVVLTKGMAGNLTLTARDESGISHSIILRIA